MAKKETKNTQKETTIYIGRSLPGLPQYTVFKHGKMPEHIAKMAENNITIAALIVPISELQQARIDIKTQGSALNFYAKQMSEE